MIRNVVIYTHKTGQSEPTRYRFDLSNLRDPIGQAHFTGKYKDGRAEAVIEWMAKDPKTQAVVDIIAMYARLHLDPPISESSISFSLFDTHGKWIAPAVAILAARKIEALGFNADVHHVILGGRGSLTYAK